MPKIVLVHSFRHGVGRSSLVANLGYLLAEQGQRVGLVDADTESPSLHYLLGLEDCRPACTFLDGLTGRCPIEESAVPVSHLLPPDSGALFFVPGAAAASPFDSPDLLEPISNACLRLVQFYQLDTLLIDSQPGLSRQALLSLTLPDVLLLVLRHDWRDYQGTGVTVDVVRQLAVPRVALLVNEAPAAFEAAALTAELADVFQSEVVAVLPHLDEMMVLPSPRIFARHYPAHPVTAILRQAANKLAG